MGFNSGFKGLKAARVEDSSSPVGLLATEDDGITILRNVGKYSPIDTGHIPEGLNLRKTAARTSNRITL